MTLALVLDGVCQTPFAPRGHPAHLATIGFNQLVHPVDGLLDGLIVELGPDDVHQLVRRHTTPSFLWDYPAYSRSRRQRSRKAVPSLPEEDRKSTRLNSSHGS